MPSHGNIAAWRIIDNIRRIDYSFVDETESLIKNAEAGGIIYINAYPAKSDSPAIKRIAEICIIYEDKTGEMFYTDDMVYIMNNEGKTCDTINI